MKEIRYNDRLWFGKYNGTRLCEIIKNDQNYVHKLINEFGFKLDQRSMDKINGRIKIVPVEPFENNIYYKKIKKHTVDNHNQADEIVYDQSMHRINRMKIALIPSFYRIGGFIVDTVVDTDNQVDEIDYDQ